MLFRLLFAALTLSFFLPLAAQTASSPYFGDFRKIAPAGASQPIPQADWYKDEVFYHVWLYAFSDSDKNGMGDIPGITARLDYLQGLGVTSLWLSPFWLSPSTHGYDVTDYYKVDPRYGTEADVKTLLASAHSRGMKVIFDFVPNHVSAANSWFLDSRANKNDKRNWFLWTDKIPAAGWKDFGNNPAWHYWGKDPVTGAAAQYNYAIFWDQMPDLNYREPAVRKAMADVITYWLNLGFDGMRVDAVKYLFENEATGANVDQKETLEFFRKLRHDILEPYGALGYPKFMVGENWTTDTDNLNQYLSSDGKTNDGLNATLDFPFGYEVTNILNATGTAEGDLGREYDNFIRGAVAEGAWTFTFLSNHDNYQSRPQSLYQSAEKVRVAQALQMTGWGTPVLYYGNEVGMAGMNGNDQNMRQPFPWKRVADYQADPESVYSWQVLLDGLRKAHPALRRGDLTYLTANPDQATAFVRTLGDDKVLVVLNLTSDPTDDFSLDLHGLMKTSNFTVLVGDTSGAQFELEPKWGSFSVKGLGPYGVRIYQLDNITAKTLRGDFVPAQP